LRGGIALATRERSHARFFSCNAISVSRTRRRGPLLARDDGAILKAIARLVLKLPARVKVVPSRAGAAIVLPLRSLEEDCVSTSSTGFRM